MPDSEDVVPKEVFARRASGLVREAGLLDAFYVGFMNQGPPTALLTVFAWGIWLFPSGDLLSSIWIATALGVFGAALTWGILGASMPRSGGSYVYNTRILHPAIGMAVSFADYFIWWLWGVILAPWVADPGLTTLFGMLEMREAAEWCATPLGMFIIATIVRTIAFLFTLFGLRVYLIHQRIVATLSLIFLIIVGFVIGMHSQAEFINAWNSLAAKYGSLDYDSMIKAAMQADPRVFAPTTGLIVGTLGLVAVHSWWTRYGVGINIIGGEIKRPQRNIMVAQIASVIGPAIIVFAFSLIYPAVVGKEFMYALAVADNVGVEGYNMPFPPNFMGILRVFVDISSPIGVALAVMMFLSFALNIYIYSVLDFVFASRIAVAWGMDRMGPKWFSEVHPKWASPVKNLIFFYVTSQIGIAYNILSGANPLSFLSCPATEGISFWLMTAIAALIFPFRKKVRSIWETSPYRKWALLGIPVVSIAAVVDLINIGIVEYYYYTTPELGAITMGGIIAFLFVWIGGALWWYYWRWKNKKEGIDIDLAWKELPPE